MSPRNPIERALGLFVNPAVNAVDVDGVMSDLDVDAVVQRIDVAEVVRRVDVQDVLDRIDVQDVIDRVDVDGAIRRVDVADVVARIDADALLARVDPNALLDRIAIDQLLTRIDLDALAARLDLDALLKGVDVDALLDRIDVTALLDRIDPNALLERVDVDALVARLDVDALLARVDVAALVQRAGIDEIVSQASKGAATRTLDSGRRQLAGLDVILVGTTERVLHRTAEPVPHDGSLTGRVAGGVSRLAAFLVDSAVISVGYGLSAALVVFLVDLLTGRDVGVGDHPVVGLVTYLSFGFLYFWLLLAITGRSIGKALCGLRVVSVDRTPISPGRAALRTLVYPFSFVLGLGLLPIVFGRRRRALHDLAGRDLVVVDWGDRPAALPAPLAAYVQRRSSALAPERGDDDPDDEPVQ